MAILVKCVLAIAGTNDEMVVLELYCLAFHGFFFRESLLTNDVLLQKPCTIPKLSYKKYGYVPVSDNNGILVKIFEQSSSIPLKESYCLTSLFHNNCDMFECQSCTL